MYQSTPSERSVSLGNRNLTNPFYARLAERQQRQRLGGQHSAPPTDDIDRTWHRCHGNTPMLTRQQQQAAFEAFEAARQQAAGQRETSPW